MHESVADGASPNHRGGKRPHGVPIARDRHDLTNPTRYRGDMSVSRFGLRAVEGFPKIGWTCIDSYDLLEDDWDGDLVPCEVCGTPHRFTHLMQHPTWPQQLEVGATCAMWMESEYATSERERAMKLRWNRRRSARKRWETKWGPGRKPGALTRTERGIRVTLFPQGNGYKFVVDGAWSQRAYLTVDEARTAAFPLFFEALEQRRA